MPYIEEKHLLEFHKTIDKSNAERDEFETHYRIACAKNKKLESERKFLRQLSTVLLVFLITGFGFYFYNPNAFDSEPNISKDDLAMVKEEITKNSTVNTKGNDNQDVLSNKLDGAVNTNQESVSNALFYAVQVAASKKRLFSFLLNESDNLLETIEEGYYKYSYGNFKTLSEAQNYRNELLNNGYEDAFVASFKNNKRIKIEEAW